MTKCSLVKATLEENKKTFSAPVENESHLAMESKKILIVEDDGNSREGLKAMLQGYGYRVDTSQNGLEAIKKIKEDRFEVAIVDINLPPVLDVPLSGWDLIPIFRSFNPTIDIIVVTGDQDNKSRAHQFELAGFLEKPIRASQLKSILQTLPRV